MRASFWPLTWQVLLDDLLHAGDHRAADVEVFLGDAVLPGGFQHGGVHGPQLGGGGGRQGPQLVLLLLLLTSTADDNTRAVTPQPLTKPGDYKMDGEFCSALVPWCSSCVASPWCVCALLVCSQCAQNRACISTGSLDIPGTAAGKKQTAKSNQSTCWLFFLKWR